MLFLGCNILDDGNFVYLRQYKFILFDSDLLKYLVSSFLCCLSITHCYVAYLDQDTLKKKRFS